MAQRFWCRGLGMILSLVLLLSPIGFGKEIVVTSTADSGHGTLRWALKVAHAGDTITFDPQVFPPNRPAVIKLKIGLPHLEQGNLTIDASDAGVILDGSQIRGGWVCGLEIASDGNKIQGLQIVGFPGAGILVSGSDNLIGGNRDSGTGPIGQGNLLCSNSDGIGLFGHETHFNIVQGNLIGTDLLGEAQRGNRYAGIFIEEGASDNTIGPGNIIAFNGCGGVEIRGLSCRRNRITKNSIYGNGGPAISALQPRAPVILALDVQAGMVSGVACPQCVVEIFSDEDGECRFFEGEVLADSDGRFVFEKGSPLRGPQVVALTTSPDAGTSALSSPLVSSNWVPLQPGNTHPRAPIWTHISSELRNNGIGSQWDLLGFSLSEAEGFVYSISQIGLKWGRVILDHGDWVDVDWSKGECSTFYISPSQRRIISGLAEQGINIMCCLVFWDKESRGQVEEPDYSRFEDEKEIQRYLSYVRFVVGELKGLVQYYEILNEPNCGEGTQQCVKMRNYIELVRRVVPVIREVDPNAKVIVGAIAAVQKWGREDLFQLLRSNIMPLVDGVSFHPLYGVSPEYDKWRAYYYGYPSMLDSIRQVATAHGFKGVLIADELTWLGPDQADPKDPEAVSYSEVRAAKYLARSIVLHRGKDYIAMPGMLGALGPSEWSMKVKSLHYLCTVLAGAVATPLKADVVINFSPIAQYGFAFENGDRMLAIWTDGVARDEDSGVPATITFPGLVAGEVLGIDPLYGFEQELAFEIREGSTMVCNLLVKDYPILLRLSGVTETKPTTKEKFGDRDGDGVPDDQDYCPDFPGRPEANGC